MDPGAWRDRLPRGQTLPPDVWARRHRAITAIAFAHVPALVLFGIVTHHALGAGILAAMPVGVLAAVGRLRQLGRRTRSCVAATALLTASAVLVHLWGGRTAPVGLGGRSRCVHPRSRRRQRRLVAAQRGCPRGQPRERGALPLRVRGRAHRHGARGARRHHLRLNGRLCERTGRGPDTLVGRRLDELAPPSDRDGSVWPDKPGSAIERRLLHADGTALWALWQHSLVRDADGAPAYWVTHCVDISERKDAELALDHQAHHDVVTGLPNRTMFLERLRGWLRDGAYVAVIFADLDDFKVINDSLGHEAGDRLLVTVAERLRRALRPGDLIVPIGAWVVEEACRQAAVWQRTAGRSLHVSVNVSPRQLSSSDVPGAVEAALADSGLDPALLTLEITESAVLADPEATTAALERLKALGVGLAIDDVGTGYSSLSQLKALLPVDTIKIDKSFVDGVTAGGDDHAIIDAVLRLATRLGLDAVAEGVETAEQAAELLGLECGFAQGYHFARPQPAADVTRLLELDALGEPVSVG